MRIEVASVTYALETVDQKILIAIEDNDDMPGVTLTVSEDTISENGGTSILLPHYLLYLEEMLLLV